MISVIIPAYNAEKYIERAIKSVLNQTYTDIEILIVNDGSTDFTEKICKRLAETDKRLRVLSKPNGGLSSARNFGIEYALGEYIAFLDADDEYDIKFLEIMLKYIMQNRADMAVCGYYSVYENRSEVASIVYDNVECLSKNEAIISLIQGIRFSSHSWNKLYCKKLFKTVRYPIGKNYEDIYVMPEILEQCSKVVFIPEHLIFYYQISSSITHQMSLKNESYAFDATYKRYLKYIDRYPDLYSFLVKEPIEIALRLFTTYKDKNNQKEYYFNIQNELEDFLKAVRNDKRSYLKLRNKYKCALMIYPLLKNKVKYKR